MYSSERVNIGYRHSGYVSHCTNVIVCIGRISSGRESISRIFLIILDRFVLSWVATDYRCII